MAYFLASAEAVGLATKYRIFLTTDERDELDSLAKKGKNSARVILLALVLLFCDMSPEGRGQKTNADISRELNISERTIESLKKRFVEGGIAYALERKQKTFNPKTIKFDGAFEARLVALASSPPPDGRARWTVRLLADKVMELGLAPDGISHMSIHRILKKNAISSRLKK
ncbi:MAG: helix-turn-helix domain-containing protein [Deltaproteobacteria bacterium]|nr:helix-turn-helix domain-containing protein [Deltaproteobacteria bacterium]